MHARMHARYNRFADKVYTEAEEKPCSCCHRKKQNDSTESVAFGDHANVKGYCSFFVLTRLGTQFEWTLRLLAVDRGREVTAACLAGVS